MALREGRLGPLTPEQTGSLEAATHHATVLRTMIHDLIDATRAQNGRLPVACRRVELARRFHNDVVRSALQLRRQRLVRWFRLAGYTALPRTADFDDTPPEGLAGR